MGQVLAIGGGTGRVVRRNFLYVYLRDYLQIIWIKYILSVYYP